MSPALLRATRTLGRMEGLPAEPVAKIHRMEQVGLIVLGSVVGALATGGVATFGAWSRRKRETQVAARLIYGDLQVMEGCAKRFSRRSAGRIGLTRRRLHMG